MIPKTVQLIETEKELLALQEALVSLQTEFQVQQPAQSTEASQIALNRQMENVERIQFESLHLEVLLQKEDDATYQGLKTEEQAVFRRCQDLCQSLRHDTKQHTATLVKVKRAWNAEHTNSVPVTEVGGPLLNDDSVSEHGEMPTLTQVSIYDALREAIKTILPDIVVIDAENRIRTAGRRLDVMGSQTLFLETEHEVDVFMDYAMFQVKSGGKNIVERHYAVRKQAYSGDRLIALAALAKARFSLLTAIRASGDEGVIMHDPLCDEKLLLIDRGLCQIVKKQSNYAVLTHYLRLDDFAMTTGASTPIYLNSNVGHAMQQTLQPLIAHQQGTLLLDERDRKQVITELYKMAIHSDAAKAVHSRQLPMHTT